MKCIEITLKIASGSISVEIRMVEHNSDRKMASFEVADPSDAREIADEFSLFAAAMGFDSEITTLEVANV